MIFESRKGTLRERRKRKRKLFVIYAPRNKGVVLLSNILCVSTCDSEIVDCMNWKLLQQEKSKNCWICRSAEKVLSALYLLAVV